MSGQPTEGAGPAAAARIAAARQALAAALSQEEVAHCERTAATARDLAQAHGLDEDKAEFAGLVHDIARALSKEELLAVARRYEIPVSNVDRARPYLLHAQVGAHLLPETLGVDDPEVIDAVASHTFGRVGMTDLDKVIYLADTIEPSRGFAGVDELRATARRDLDEAMRVAYRLAINHLTEKGRPLHPRTVEVWNWLTLAVEEA